MSLGPPFMCATCGGQLPSEASEGAAVCRFCGAVAVPRAREAGEREASRAAAEVGGALRCPRCDRAFEPLRAGAKHLSVCERCGGLWVDAETAAYLERVRDHELETAVRRAVAVVVALPPRVRTATVMCPVCGEATHRRAIEGTGQSVDVCTAHGTWFDHDELALFVEQASAERAGDVSADDRAEAGLTGGGAGFFGRIFRALRS